MQVFQWKHPCRSEYQTPMVIDPTEVKARHYEVNVDIYDERTTDILVSILSIFCQKNNVTLRKFGNNVHRIQFQMDHDEWYVMKHANRELDRICKRCAQHPALSNDYIMKPCCMVE